MHRSLFPFILASIGFLAISFAVAMPLFEWQISEIVTDFPPAYEVDILPSPWAASLGSSLDDGSYILRGRIRVIGDGAFCRKENLKFVVRRSRSDEIIEQVLNANQKNISWLFVWSMTELILSGIYIWWFIIEYKHHSAFQAAVFTGIAGVICIFLMLFARVVGLYIPYSGISDCYGTVIFSARLSKVHFETLLVLCAAILAEVGALGVILRQIIKAVRERKRL